MPKDAEAWLAARGITREPLVLEQLPPSGPEPVAGEGVTAPATPVVPDPSIVTARDAGRLALQSAMDAATTDGDTAAAPRVTPNLADDVAAAVGFIRRSTSGTPQSEGRLRDKLSDRGVPAAVIDSALERARDERLVDDPALAAALVASWRSKGHAVARIRRSLQDRCFDAATITTALGVTAGEDPEAAAFAIARDRADRLTGVPADAAHRRVVGFLLRRGYPDGLARKVAREAVFTTREQEHIAGR